MSDIAAVKERGARLGHTARRVGRFAHYVLRRFIEDGCFAAAGALSYTTLVSLVPLLAISLAILSAFPIFNDLRDQALGVIFDAFVPRIGGTVDHYITSFVEMAGKTTAVGVAVLAVTATMLLATIEDRLNAIWRVHAPRRWTARITIYWTVLTLGPMLFGLAFSISNTVQGLGNEFVPGESVPTLTVALRQVAVFVPLLVECVALTCFYCLIPYCPVRWRDALFGAVVASVAIEICRWGFTIYLDHFNSYEAIYGALAAIPIFLLWMYFTWSVVLFGAEIAAAVPLWQSDEDFVEKPEPDALALALGVLENLVMQGRGGGSVRLTTMARNLSVPVPALAASLERLVRGGFASASLDGGYVLARDSAAVSLLDLKRAVERRPGSGARKLDEPLGSIRDAEAQALSVPVSRFIRALNSDQRVE